MMINSLSSMGTNRSMRLSNGITKDTNSGTFVSALQSASQQAKENQDSVQFSAQSTGNVPTLTDDAKNSTGEKTLTDVQKQYLRDKYHLSDSSDLSESELNQLLIELTNDGALSYQDYRLADAAPTTPAGTVAISSQESAKDLFSSSRNYSEYFQNVIDGEKEEAGNIREHYGVEASSYGKCVEAHQRIENLLNSLL